MEVPCINVEVPHPGRTVRKLQVKFRIKIKMEDDAHDGGDSFPRDEYEGLCQKFEKPPHPLYSKRVVTIKTQVHVLFKFYSFTCLV
jgi:hypothetical protein